MPVTATTSEELFVGAGDLYIDGAAAGATMDNNAFRVRRTYYTPDLNGVRGPLKGTDYISEEVAELECTLPELSASNLAIMIPGSSTTAMSADGVLLGGGGDTTLAAQANAGATNIKVTAVTNFAAGDIVQIGPTGGTREFRKVLVVGTGGSGGTGIDVDVPLLYTHANGEVFQEVVSTTLAADAPVNATNLKVAAVTGLVVGDYVQFGRAGEREVRKLTFVGTTGSGGTGISFAQPTTMAHRINDEAFEVSTEGVTRFTSTTERRLPTSAYHDFELRVPGLNGRYISFQLDDAVMLGDVSFEAGDDATMAPRVTLRASWDPASPTTPPWRIDRRGQTS